ncbi:uncharacterized protein LTR77_009454 [Saxophila tyrrhenica]|uniref:MARVEL domain-containing protein n=1 Tax=Saxophila tyrrhenica TaxID=1690608 RepID=A0AAV9P1I8_9PEZI|nr:hypothetical protein LTR77_009454 [Saxophila tyrrhenica]
MSQILNLVFRGLQFFFALLVMALTGDMISDAFAGNPSIINYAMFCAVFAMLCLFYLIPASFMSSLALGGMVPLAIDALNTLFWFCGAVAYAAELGVHSCSNNHYLRNNRITNGADNMHQRCQESQAVTAFLWFGFACFAVSTALSGMASRGSGGGSSGIRRGPAMSQV